MTKVWKSEMPSNIALIKYMGKKDKEKNIPSNTSLSWTLPHLLTRVDLEVQPGGEDRWEALPSDFPFEMSQKGLKKFLDHLHLLKAEFGIKENFIVRSSNNFPADCGIASSASSFAALTETACMAFAEMTGTEIGRKKKAQLSAVGSGSSCRSFFEGMVEWNEEGVKSLDHPFESLYHMVVLVGAGKKEVSSSDAHIKVESSLLFEGRAHRCEKRREALLESWTKVDWEASSQIIWSEFQDMHALFETSQPSFSYMLPGTIDVLNAIRTFWKREGRGPWVTMDAGPNIHLLWNQEQKDLSLKFYKEFLLGRWSCLSNVEEIGFAQV